MRRYCIEKVPNFCARVLMIGWLNFVDFRNFPISWKTLNLLFSFNKRGEIVKNI